MRRDPVDLLEDVRDAIANIESFTRGCDAQRLESDLLVQPATLWNLAIIGEAVNNLRRVDLPKAERISEYRRIISAWQQITHGYDEVDPATVWRIVTTKLPILKREVDALLAE